MSKLSIAMQFDAPQVRKLSYSQVASRYIYIRSETLCVCVCERERERDLKKKRMKEWRQEKNSSTSKPEDMKAESHTTTNSQQPATNITAATNITHRSLCAWFFVLPFRVTMGSEGGDICMRVCMGRWGGG